MTEIVAAALAAHAPLITGKPEVGKPEQRDRLYAGFRELRRRLQAARPDLLVMFVNDHLQNFAYNNLPAFCIGLAPTYQCPSEGGARLMRLTPRTGRGTPEWAMRLLEAGLEAGIDFAYSYEIGEMAGHALSEPERAALRAGDTGRLYELGANPYLIRRVFRRRFAI